MSGKAFKDIAAAPKYHGMQTESSEKILRYLVCVLSWLNNVGHTSPFNGPVLGFLNTDAVMQRRFTDLPYVLTMLLYSTRRARRFIWAHNYEELRLSVIALYVEH